MASIDHIKEDLGWLKVLFTVSAALDAALIGWIVQHYQSTHLLLSSTAIIGAALLGAVIAFAVISIYRLLAKLEA